ncbi:AIPR family protein [Dactylosporangium sp. CA-139066]|uniref:AIPR family protein n=1 Tax=Dactylosporangium sp. CA-139066 TaxID=3239930 RepID=UPI003D8D218D
MPISIGTRQHAVRPQPGVSNDRRLSPDASLPCRRHGIGSRSQMMPDDDISAYAHILLEEVRVQAEADGCDLSEAFARLMLDQFSGDGYTEDATVIMYRDHGVEISGYGVSSDDRCLDLFATIYSPRADEGYKINRQELDAATRRLQNFLLRSIPGTPRRKNLSSEVLGMEQAVAAKFHEVDKVRLIIVTNARSVVREPALATEIEGRQILRELWDLRRLAAWAASGSQAEPIVAEFPDGLPCLATPSTTEDYSVFLAIVPGPALAALYGEHGGRLLELNVRSFLQTKGAVNKGIQETLRATPARFLAYNNGIAATASSVEFGPDATGQRVIQRIHNLQIVNGGQTTASIHHAQRLGVDISDVLVQMKLTVVSDDRIDEIVPRISQYSNTQNKVTASDLRANSGFHVDVERIMRTLLAPPGPVHSQDTHWYYERARGQYANAVARETTPARRATFRASNPADQKFTKADLAKFEQAWARMPHLVSRGAEKNFVLFQERLKDEPVTVDKDYCRRLIAKAILFRRTDKIVADQNFGGYKINIVAYTIAFLVHATQGRIDLDRIWRDQDLSPALREAIAEVAVLVQKVITSPPDGRAHVGEWAKLHDCWDAVRDLDWQPSAALQAELAHVDTYADDLELINRTAAHDWSDLAEWGRAEGVLDDAACRTVSNVAEALREGWSPAGRDVLAAVPIMRLAQRRGFRKIPGF